ncbi:FAD-dependent oxidoreductase [Rubneribacter sp.]
MALDRRGFLKGALGLGALAAAGATAGGCAPNGAGDADAGAAVNGTFEGVGQGMQGDIKVSIDVSSGIITNVDVVEAKETPHVAEVALERIPAQIVEHQTTTLDTVTGATLCSMGLMAAAEDAAKNAGLDMGALKKNAYTASPGPDETWDTDVLVIGGGGAAWSAAITAAEAGSQVTLIEKGSVFGGNTMMAGAAFNAVDPDAQAIMRLSAAQKGTLDGYLALSTDDPALKFDQFPEWKDVLVALQDEIRAYYAANEGKTPGVDLPGFDSVSLHMWHIYVGGLRELSDGTWIASNIDLARTLAENALGTFEWMDAQSMECVYGSKATEGLYTVLGAMWPRTHTFVEGKDRITCLREAAEKVGVSSYAETAAKQLVMDGNAVAGAVAERSDGTKITINAAQGVVLACGGYCANPAMVKEYDKYWGDDLSDTTLTTNMGTNEGDGIVMAQEVGAATTGLEVAQMMPSSSPVKGTMTDGVWGDASEQIWIDGAGNRFVDEYAERDVLAKASLKLEGGIFYILYAGVAGEDGWVKGAEYESMAPSGSIKDFVESGQVWYGETLEELAEASKSPAAGVAPGFSADALRATIETYNRYFENQKDDDFGKEVISGAVDIEAVEGTQGVGFVISPRRASLHHTMGGVVIDAKARVLDEQGQVIEGLFAAGEVTGGVHAGNRLGGNAIADIFTFGQIAGRGVSAR